MKNQLQTVVKSNRVVEASYSLTTNEQRILLIAMSQIDSRQTLDPLQGFEVSANDLTQLSDSKTKNEYRDLKAAAEQLLNRIVTINNPFADEKRVTQLKTHWISSIAYVPNEGKIRLYFAPHLLPYISQLTSEFTKYQLQEVGKFSSIYSFRLFELIQQWKTAGKREIEIEWLRKCFELGDKYSAIKDFKVRILDPAVSEINELTSYQVSWTQRKTGRKVTHLIFTFSEKKPETEKQKRPTKKEKTIYGVPVSEIEKNAKIGESHEQAAGRINRDKVIKKPSPQTQKTAVPVSDLIAKTGIIKPQPVAPVVSSSAAESEAHRIGVINFFISKNKSKYLEEFNNRGCVSIHGISGVVIEADLKLAGLFD